MTMTAATTQKRPDVDEVKQTTLQLIKELRAALDEFEAGLVMLQNGDQEDGDADGR